LIFITLSETLDFPADYTEISAGNLYIRFNPIVNYEVPFKAELTHLEYHRKKK